MNQPGTEPRRRADQEPESGPDNRPDSTAETIDNPLRSHLKRRAELPNWVVLIWGAIALAALLWIATWQDLPDPRSAMAIAAAACLFQNSYFLYFERKRARFLLQEENRQRASQALHPVTETGSLAAAPAAPAPAPAAPTPKYPHCGNCGATLPTDES